MHSSGTLPLDVLLDARCGYALKIFTWIHIDLLVKIFVLNLYFSIVRELPSEGIICSYLEVNLR